MSEETRRRGNLEIVRRTGPGVYAYIVLALIIAAGTHLREDYPAVIIGLLVSQFAIAVLRSAWGRAYEAHYARNPRRARLMFTGLVLAAGMLWGVFAGFTLAIYGTTWTTFLVMLCTAGLLAGGTTALCLRRGLHTAWITAMTGPLILVCLRWTEGHGLLFGAVTFLYVVFLLREAKYLHRSFWRSLEKSLLLNAENQRKRTFLASVSHEVRTPMTCILGMLQLVREDPSHPANAERLKTVDSSARELVRLVNELLDVPEIEDTTVEIAIAPYDLRDCVAEVVRLVMPQAAQKSVAMSVECDDQLPPQLAGDRGRVRQVLLNLVHNAVRYTEVGAVTVTAAPAVEGAWAEIVVEDTGSGMTEDDVRRALAGTPARGDDEGRMGLRNAQYLVHKMGGTLSIESDVGVGTRAVVSLPMITHTPSYVPAPTPPPTPVEDEPAREPKLQLRPGHVLIVGGEERELRRMQAALELGGHHVSWVESPGHAHRILAAHPRRVDALVFMTPADAPAAAAAAAELRRALRERIGHVSMLATTDDLDRALSSSLGTELDDLVLRDPSHNDPGPIVSKAMARRRTRKGARPGILRARMFL